MSLQRRTMGRGRIIAAVSAIVIVIGCILPWFRAGSAESGIPPVEGNALAGVGILTFLAALGVLALVALPFAAGERPVSFDRWWAYALLALIAGAGIVLRVIGIEAEIGTFEAFLPDRAPGLWLSAAGTVGVAVGAAEIRGEQPGR
ncbi:MAG: hypothetical protein H6Q36_919 [Chloroflexi bacterium]|jgi:hypothetical protein|nr:hypothetical protein [Chloroflexota bacterium]